VELEDGERDAEEKDRAVDEEEVPDTAAGGRGGTVRRGGERERGREEDRALDAQEGLQGGHVVSSGAQEDEKRKRAHLDGQAVGEEAQEPAERDRRQLDALVLEVRGELGQRADDEVLQDLLVGARDEQVRGVVVGREDVLRAGERARSKLSSGTAKRARSERAHLDDADEHPEGVLLGRMRK